MTPDQKTAAVACLNGAETGTMDFPAIVGRLIEAGFESYAVDYRRSQVVYSLPDGDSIALPAHATEVPVAAAFDQAAIQAAIRDAQTKAPGYTYAGFCRRAAEAGCAGYIVSFSGRRVLYHGRTAETHVEHFPE